MRCWILSSVTCGFASRRIVGIVVAILAVVSLLGPTAEGQSSDRRPDLIAEPPRVSVFFTAPRTQPPETTITLNAIVHNRGRGDAAATTLRYYRSSDSRISKRDDFQVTSTSISSLKARRSNLGSWYDTRVPTRPGTYYYGACVDVVENENRIDNNCSSSVPVSRLQNGRVIIGE